MSQASRESLHEIFRNLHASRVATMDPEILQVNIDQRRLLVETADRSRFVKPGDVVEPFSVPEVDGREVALAELVARGPTVLIFFRFESCPACNLALPYYERNLWPGLQALGATLVALSPQVPEKLGPIKKRHGLTFSVASDVDNGLGRRFGILYAANEASRKLSLKNGKPIGEITGTGTWELPMPTAVVIDSRRTVRFADVHPDWLVRTEAAPILNAVAAISAHSSDRTPYAAVTV